MTAVLVRPSDLRRSLDWMDDAACDGRTNLFFSEDHEERDEAKRMCLYRCPVLAECREWRKRVRPSHGIWAGRGASAHHRRD